MPFLFVEDTGLQPNMFLQEVCCPPAQLTPLSLKPVAPIRPFALMSES